METHFDIALRQLKAQILSMGSQVERAIEEAVQGLIERKKEHFASVYETEKKINQAHMQIDDTCIRLLACQSPLASSLRFIVAAIKINTDLERMGDQAVNISHNAEHHITLPPLKPLVDIPKMAHEVQSMVREALDAFVRSDLALARNVLTRDDLIDDLKGDILNALTVFMENNPHEIRQAIHLILIARNLERLGDHATNIAEDVIFVIAGEDIRHGKILPGPRDQVAG